MNLRTFILNLVVYSMVVVAQLSPKARKEARDALIRMVKDLAQKGSIDERELLAEIDLRTQELQYQLRFYLANGHWPDEY